MADWLTHQPTNADHLNDRTHHAADRIADGTNPRKNTMSLTLTRSIPVRCAIAALLVAIAGMVIQISTGVKYPTVPPGVVILAVTALLLSTVLWPGVRILGVLAPLFVLVGGVVSGTGRTNISHLSPLGPFLGTLVQFGGLAAAVLAGIAALAEWRAGVTDRQAAAL
jgi:hypothetical protein